MPVTVVNRSDCPGLTAFFASIPWAKIRHFCWNNQLPLGLVFGILYGLLFPAFGSWLATTKFSLISVLTIFFIQGLRLSTDELKDAVTSIRPTLYGVIMILGLSPLLAMALIHLNNDPATLDPTSAASQHRFHFTSFPVALGISIFFLMPATISAGVIYTRECAGHVPLALLLCVISNILAIFTIPFMVEYYVMAFLQETQVTSDTTHEQVAVDSSALLIDLIATILFPLILGKLTRDFSTAARQFTERPSSSDFLKVLSNICLILLPVSQVSHNHSQFSTLSVGEFFVVVFLGIIFHCFLLAFNYILTSKYVLWDFLRLSLKKQKAVVILASQKTVAIGLTVATELAKPSTKSGSGSTQQPNIFAQNTGLIVVPMILCHLLQTVIDGVLASQWKKVIDPEEELEKERKMELARLEKEQQEKEQAEREEKQREEMLLRERHPAIFTPESPLSAVLAWNFQNPSFNPATGLEMQSPPPLSIDAELQTMETRNGVESDMKSSAAAVDQVAIEFQKRLGAEGKSDDSQASEQPEEEEELLTGT